MEAGPFQRKTRPRQVILEGRRFRSHLAAPELDDLVRRRLPRISLGTVYRNRDLLAEGGVIRKLHLGSGEARFDGDPVPRCHLRCLDCGRVEDAEAVPAGCRAPELTTLDGFEVVGCRMEFVGVCPRCRRRKGPPRREAKYRHA